MVDFRSCFPNSFDFKQMNVILKLIRQRMDVDNFSRLENRKESYYNCQPRRRDKRGELRNVMATRDYSVRADNLGLA